MRHFSLMLRIVLFGAPLFAGCTPPKDGPAVAEAFLREVYAGDLPRILALVHPDARMRREFCSPEKMAEVRTLFGRIESFDVDPLSLKEWEEEDRAREPGRTAEGPLRISVRHEREKVHTIVRLRFDEAAQGWRVSGYSGGWPDVVSQRQERNPWQARLLEC